MAQFALGRFLWMKWCITKEKKDSTVGMYLKSSINWIEIHRTFKKINSNFDFFLDDIQGLKSKHHSPADVGKVH